MPKACGLCPFCIDNDGLYLCAVTSSQIPQDGINEDVLDDCRIIKPIKPIKDTIKVPAYYYENAKRIEQCFWCGACHEDIVFGQKYCSECGTHIDWN